MSIFSSLNYLVKRTSTTFLETATKDHTLNNILRENKNSNKHSMISRSQILTDDVFSCKVNLHFDDFSNKEEISKSLDTILFDKFIKCMSENTTDSKIYVGENEKYTSEVIFSNETVPDPGILFESWWNVFDERYLRHGWGWTITLIIAYMLILVAGVIGNVMVILVVLLRPQMRTVTNMFITNLAIADLFVIVFCVPSTLLANIFAPWILGSTMCKAVAYVQGIFVCASAYSLAAISLDRCQAVYRNYERPRGFSQTICARTICMIWIASMCLTIPWAVIFDLKISEFDGVRYCMETWEVETNGNIYFLVVNLFGFYTIPLLLMFVSNWIIYCHVTHRHVPQDSVSAAPIRKLHRQTRRVVLRTLGIATLTFLFSWLPLYIIMIRVRFSKNITESEYKILEVFIPIAQWLACWNSSINPMLYAFLNKKFRRMFHSILPAWIPVKAAGQFVGSIRTPSFTNTACTRRSVSRSKSDLNHLHQNEHMNSPKHANLLVTRFYKRKGTMKTTTIQIIITAAPPSTSSISGSRESIFDTAFAERNIGSTDIIAEV